MRRGPPPRKSGATLDQYKSGGVLLSHTVSHAVPSALKGLTSGFGMEPGVSLSPKPPNTQPPTPHKSRAGKLQCSTHHIHLTTRATQDCFLGTTQGREHHTATCFERIVCSSHSAY